MCIVSNYSAFLSLLISVLCVNAMLTLLYSILLMFAYVMEASK